MKCDTSNTEEEGELFDFESGDEVLEANQQAPDGDDGTRVAEAGGADENTSPAGQCHSHAALGPTGGFLTSLC